MSVEEEILEALEEDESYVMSIITPSDKYFDVNMTVLSNLVKTGRKCVYVTMNKPFKSLESSLADQGVDTESIFFIDAISKTVGVDVEDVDNCIFLDHPSSLTQLNIVLTDAMEKISPEFLVLDSLSTLLIYNKEKTTMKFVHSLTGLVRENEVRGIIFSLEEDMAKDTIAPLTQFCDRVITLDHNGDDW